MSHGSPGGRGGSDGLRRGGSPQWTQKGKLVLGAVIYCRVSTKEQVENLSLPTQQLACEEYCQREGLTILRVFVDRGESAKTTERPELQQLLAYCRQNKGRIQCLVVYNVTRFARQRYDHVALRVLLQKLGVTLRSVTEPIDDTSTGQLMEGILASFAQFDNDQKAERTKTGMVAALQRGRWTFKAPLGYRNSSNGTASSSLVLDPERAPLIRQAFEVYGAGHQTSQQVLRQVTALGLTTQRGRALSPQTFGALLRNRIYAGWIEVPSLGVSAQGDFTPLVSEELFQRVQGLLAGKGVALKPHQRNHPDFPLRRFVACAKCGTPLTGSRSTGRSRTYAYYHCRSCGAVRVAKERLESGFIALIERLQPNVAYMRLFREIVLDCWKDRQVGATRLRGAIERRVTDLGQRLDQVEEAFLYKHTVDQATYERQRDKLREDMALAQIELHEAELEELDVEGVLAFADHLLTNAARLWMEASLDQKQRLQNVFFPEGLRFDGQEFGTAVTCLAFKQLPLEYATESSMASPTGFEPVSQP